MTALNRLILDITKGGTSDGTRRLPTLHSPHQQCRGAVVHWRSARRRYARLDSQSFGTLSMCAGTVVSCLVVSFFNLPSDLLRIESSSAKAMPGMAIGVMPAIDTDMAAGIAMNGALRISRPASWKASRRTRTIFSPPALTRFSMQELRRASRKFGTAGRRRSGFRSLYWPRSLDQRQRNPEQWRGCPEFVSCNPVCLFPGKILPS